MFMRRLPKKLFTSTARYYARYRPPYPKQFFTYLVWKFRLQRTGRLLDLGCGTGELILPLAKHVAEAIGVDPEREMLAEAKQKAARRHIRNVRWIHGKAEAVIPTLKPVRLAVMGRSFHWMDRGLVLRRLDKVIEPDGGVVVVAERGIGKPPQWRAAMDAVAERYLGKRRRAGCGFYVKPRKRHEEVLAASPFRRIGAYRHRVTHRWSIRELIGYLYSKSSSSRWLLGRNAKAFERDMKRALCPYKAEGALQERVMFEALVARRPTRR